MQGKASNDVAVPRSGVGAYLHVVEHALPDCEVLFHSLPTLSRIVARGRRSYVSGENPKPWRNPAMVDVLDGVREPYDAAGLTERLRTAKDRT